MTNTLALPCHLRARHAEGSRLHDEARTRTARRIHGRSPGLGKPGKIAGTREVIPHQNYRLVYEVAEADGTVWVLALVHTARQWPPGR